MEVKDLFARVLAQKDTQFVVTCNLPVIEVKPEECRAAYEKLSRTEKCLLKSRINRQVISMTGSTVSEPGQQLKMLKEIQKVLM